MSQLIWVAVPDGRTPDGAALIRLLVVPRLAPGHISVVGMADWPAVLSDAEFVVVTKTPSGPAVEHPAEYQGEAQSYIWNEFFGGEGGNINSLNLTDHPAPTVTDTYRDARGATDTTHTVITQLATLPAQPDNIIETQLSGWKQPAPTPPAADGQPANPIPDFHRSVSMLREHPTVLQALGLIIELRVDPTALDECQPEDGFTVSVRAASPSLLTPPFVLSPWTRYEFSPRVFRPAPDPTSNSGVRGGMLDLRGADLIAPSAVHASPSPPSWALVTFDVDGAVAALRQAAAAVSSSRANAATPGGPPANPPAMPAIRSLGLSLLRPAFDADLAQRSQRAADRALRSMHDTELTADDLILGYRIDIKVGDEAWLPLCERDATYFVNDIAIAPTAPQPEQGHVSPFSAVKIGNCLYTDKLVVHWDGWSLAAPVIRLAADPPGTLPPGPVRDLPYNFTWEFSPPPGRLPRLRFGTRYKMRVRIADLAGGGLRFDEVPDDTPAATATIVYTRYDPLPPPTLQSETADFGPGAAVDRMVIRSDRGKTPEDLQAEDPHYPATETRELAPPRAPLKLIEQHGALDDRTDEDSWSLASRAIAADPDDPTAGLADPAASGINAYIAAASEPTASGLEGRVKWSPRWPGMAPKTVNLRGAADTADLIAMDWSPDTLSLNVTLAQGEQATIELSSTIRDGWQDNFAMGDWLASGSVALANTMNGRNPAVTPPVRLQVVHAVRQPLSDPRWTLNADAVIREEHETSVLLRPHFDATPAGVPGLHIPSTGRLDITAEWTETQDSGPSASTTTHAVANDHFFSTTVDIGPPPAPQIRHEIGDTRHRVIRYTLHAISRYRHYFEPDETDEHFHVSEEQPPVVVVSSARPGPLTILGVGPAFNWQPPTVGPDRIEHVRQANRIRVEVARPWFQTGEGELLGVLAATTATPSDGPVTQMGRDPLFGSPATPHYPPATTFIDTADAPLSVQLAETGQTVTVVPYAVEPGGDRWYADIALDRQTVGRFYNPFIQLAVGRLQLSSRPGLELSRVAVTDTVPVLPDRRVVVQHSGAQVVVTVGGTGPNPANNVSATLEQASDAAAEAIELVSTDTATGGVPAWVPLSSVSGTLGTALPPLTLPTTAAPMRIRITESEALPRISSTSPQTDLDQRNVFIDTLDIPAQWQQH